MPHAPFIIVSYSLAVLLLVWCAVAPLVRKKRLIKMIRLSALNRSSMKSGVKNASDT